MKILVAGIGNLLRGDDGFGVCVVQRLEQTLLPGAVTVVECGISGMSLVHALMDGYDACIIADASRRGGVPGTLYVLEPVTETVSRAAAAAVDAHTAEPSQALRLAAALGILPALTYVVACEPAEVDEFQECCTPVVERAVGEASRIIADLIGDLLAHPQSSCTPR